MSQTLLLRYGAIPVVSRFHAEAALPLSRGTRTVVKTSRGLEIGTVLETVESGVNGEALADETGSVVRVALPDDEAKLLELRRECEIEFEEWRRRIAGWNLHLELIDLEWTLDRGRLILYVLNERGPDCTKLALQAAAAGLGPVEVQPVDSEGLMQVNLSTGGCGSGGCGCDH